MKKLILAVDMVIQNDENQVALIKRKYPPFAGQWALIGGQVEIERDETFVDAALREAGEEAGVQITLREIIGVYDDPKRDPRGRVISVAFSTYTPYRKLVGSHEGEVEWFSLSELPQLAFDHRKIIEDGIFKCLVKQ